VHRDREQDHGKRDVRDGRELGWHLMVGSAARVTGSQRFE
jgi:hypothetical protein